MPPYVKKGDCFWSDDDKAKLKQLADDGLSASQACQYFQGMTRNAACGLAFRIKVSFNSGRGGNFLINGEPRPKRERLPRENKPRKPKHRFMKQQFDEKPIPLPLDEPIPECFMLEFSELNLSQDCLYIFGHVRDNTHRYCGLPAIQGTSWCRHHRALIYNPPQERRRGETITLASV